VFTVKVKLQLNAANEINTADTAADNNSNSLSADFFEATSQALIDSVSLAQILQETQLSLRDRATRACQLKSGKVLHKCRRLVFEKV